MPLEASGTITRAGESPIRVLKSIFQPADIALDIADRYDIPGASGEFILPGLNDTYLIQTAERRAVLRLYQHGWRDSEEIRYELELLLHLAEKHLPVSVALADRFGDYIHSYQAPEGERPAVLFTFAEGDRPLLNPEMASQVGRLMADLHVAADDFETNALRRPRDLSRLDEALSLAEPLFVDRAEDFSCLEHVRDVITNRVKALVSGLNWGPCHGDLWQANLAQAPSGELTLFDFDLCGPGWRAEDLGFFKWNSLFSSSSTASSSWEAFLDGYQSVRPLSPAEAEVVDVFVGVTHLLSLGLTVMRSRFQGSAMLGQRQMDARLRAIRRWEENLPEAH